RGGSGLGVRPRAAAAPPGGAPPRPPTAGLPLCAAPPSPARRGTPATPSALVHHVCLRYSRQKAREEWAFVGAGGAPLAVSVDGPLAISSGTALREAAVAGLGLAVLPASEVADELAAGRLQTVLEGTLRNAALGIYALHPYGRRPPARVRAFVDFLADWFREPRWPRTLAPRRPSREPRGRT